MESSRNWKKEELAYLAGLIDGEGTISIGYCYRNHKSGRKRYHKAIMSISNTDYRLIEWIKNLFGGYVGVKKYEGKTYKTIYRWSIDGTNIDNILKSVSPYLIIKREQAFLVLELRKTLILGNNQYGSRITDELTEKRENFREKILKLNKRGISNELDIFRRPII